VTSERAEAVRAAAPSYAAGMPGECVAPMEAVAPALPELAVPSHVLVLQLPLEPGADAQARLLAEWLALDPALAHHRDELMLLLAAASGEPGVGEVAAFLTHRDVAGSLVGGAGLLVLELLEPAPGSPGERAAHLCEQLQRTAESIGHGGGLAEVGLRQTTSGVSAVRLRFLGIAAGGRFADGTASTTTPAVEACLWLYPVPGCPDLAWSLYFQTTDLADADPAIEEFDRMAGSLSWADAGDDTGTEDPVGVRDDSGEEGRR
jgi:hypothetical protein